MLCNFCGSVSEVPPDYACNLGMDGQRADRYDRPELCRGSMEFAVTADYMVRERRGVWVGVGGEKT
jgi:protein transport protein SEC24